MGDQKKIYFFILLSMIYARSVSACHQAMRRQRTLENPDLVGYMSTCLYRNGGKRYNWQAISKFVVQDTKWFEDTENTYCGKDDDTRECWQNELDFIIDPFSTVTDLIKYCIQLYAGGGKPGYMSPQMNYDNSAMLVARSGRKKRSTSHQQNLMYLLIANMQRRQQQAYRNIRTGQTIYGNPTPSPNNYNHNLQRTQSTTKPPYHSYSQIIYKSPGVYTHPNPPVHPPTNNDPRNYHPPSSPYSNNNRNNNHYTQHGVNRNHPQGIPRAPHNHNNHHSYPYSTPPQQHHLTNTPYYQPGTSTIPQPSHPPTTLSQQDRNMIMLLEAFSPSQVTTTTPPTTTNRAMGTMDLMKKFLESLSSLVKLDPKAYEGTSSLSNSPEVTSPFISAQMCDEQTVVNFINCVANKLSLSSFSERSLNDLSAKDLLAVLNFFRANHSKCKVERRWDYTKRKPVRYCSREITARSGQVTCLPTIMLNMLRDGSRVKDTFLSCTS